MVSCRGPARVPRPATSSVVESHSPFEITLHNARVIRDGLMRAVIALLQMGAQRGGAACADVPECSPLMGRERMAPSLEKLLFVLAKDIGDFQPMCGHCCCGSSFIERMGFS